MTVFFLYFPIRKKIMMKNKEKVKKKWQENLPSVFLTVVEGFKRFALSSARA